MIPKGDLTVEGKYLAPGGIIRYGQIEIKGGMINYAGPIFRDPDIVFPDGLTIMPGFIDIHVHGREYPLPWQPTQEQVAKHLSMLEKETFESVTRAAINGGVTAIALMPNDPIAPKDLSSYNAKKRLAAAKCGIDHICYALIDKKPQPFGNVPYKLYTHDFSPKEIRDLLQEFRGLRYDPLIVVHAENRNVITAQPDRPAEAEVRDVSMMLDIAAKYKLKIHFSHISTAESLDLITQAKAQNMKVSCETTPTYLYFTDDIVSTLKNRGMIFMKPPFRGGKDRERLLEGVIDGEVDCLATDHAPHTEEHKRQRQFGIPMLDDYTHMVGWLMQQGVSDKRILELCCTWPGKFMQTYIGDTFGELRKGAVGNLVVVEKKYPVDVHSETIESKCGWSPFEGAELGKSFRLDANTVIARGVQLKPRLDRAA